MMSDENKDSKIVVDDDWKAQVEAEKKEYAKQAADVKDDDQHGQKMPEANFMTLVSSLATQALMSLGQLLDPYTQKPTINKPMAKHFIDTLAMLDEKTKGNLEKDEAASLTDILHQLRMVFVNTPDKMPEGPGGAEPEKKESKIELP